jgi:hypothetical protein
MIVIGNTNVIRLELTADRWLYLLGAISQLPQQEMLTEITEKLARQIREMISA